VGAALVSVGRLLPGTSCQRAGRVGGLGGEGTLLQVQLAARRRFTVVVRSAQEVQRKGREAVGVSSVGVMARKPSHGLGVAPRSIFRSLTTGAFLTFQAEEFID
jgi:hypothetical protein